jgi:hypothetical protein
MPRRPIFFAINFSVAVLILLADLSSTFILVAKGSEAGTLVTGVLFAVPPLAIAIGELVLFLRGGATLQTSLGVVYQSLSLPACFLGLFFIVCTPGHSPVQPGTSAAIPWYVMGSALIAFAAYCYFCCRVRERPNVKVNPRGFAVGDQIDQEES